MDYTIPVPKNKYIFLIDVVLYVDTNYGIRMQWSHLVLELYQFKNFYYTVSY